MLRLFGEAEAIKYRCMLLQISLNAGSRKLELSDGSC